MTDVVNTGTGTLVDVVERYYRAVDAHDLDTLLELFAPDAVYLRPGYPAMHGTAALRRFYSQERIISSGHHELTSVVPVGDTVAVQGHFTGRSVAGDPLDVEFADFFRGTATIDSRQTYFYVAAV